jgi:hypothetical protein
VSGSALAVAHANIALAKYWGKALDGANLPAVPSLSLTLAGLCTLLQLSMAPANSPGRWERSLAQNEGAGGLTSGEDRPSDGMAGFYGLSPASSLGCQLQ